MASNNIKITFVVPEKLQQDLRRQIIADGYGMRGKSRWISEAIQQLLDLSDFPDFVQYSEEMSGFTCSETIVISPALKRALDGAILKVRLLHPTFEGVQSCIVRTSIIQRLIRS